jgi:hypothetical protein
LTDNSHSNSQFHSQLEVLQEIPIDTDNGTGLPEELNMPEQADEFQDIDHFTTNDESVENMSPLLSQVLLAYGTDPNFRKKAFTKQYRKTHNGFYLLQGQPKLKKTPTSGATGEDEREAELNRTDYTSTEFECAQIVVPNNYDLRQYIISHCHDRAYSGHRGFLPTKHLVAKHFYWFGLDKDVNDYVKSCDTCQRVKPLTGKPHGVLQPLPIPTRRGGSISLDQIVALPLTGRRFDAILVVVDRFTKYTHFIPCKTSDTAKTLAALLFQRVLCHTGLPDDIVSDRDKRFSTGTFIREVWRLFDTHQSPSTAYHPQSDGQTKDEQGIS